MAELSGEELAVPPTEQELASVVSLCWAAGGQDDADVIRRLIFQRDRLLAEKARMREAMDEAVNRLTEMRSDIWWNHGGEKIALLLRKAIKE